MRDTNSMKYLHTVCLNGNRHITLTTGALAYIGIGAGAHGKISWPGEQKITRRANTRQPGDYLNPNKPYATTTQEIPGRQLPLEFMMNALRLVDGVPYSLFAERTGLCIETIDKPVRTLVQRGLLVDNQSRLATTARGQLLLNSILAEFMV